MNATTAAPTTRRPGKLRSAVHAARQALLRRQKPDGHWVGELQGDTILESEFALLLAFLGRLDDPDFGKLAAYIRQQQQPDGGWTNYPGGPADVSVSVKAYFALKLAGDPTDAPHMARAADVIRGLGGAEACNSFTRFYLALLGQIPYRNCAAVPPELLLLPRWSYIHLGAMSSWTRTIVVPLSVVYAHKPCTPVPAGRGIAELFLGDPRAPRWPARPTRHWASWTNVFLALDAAYKRCERFLGPVRRRAVRRAVAWMRERFADSDGLGAIFPPMIYTVIVLRCLGVPDDDPEMRWALQQLADLKIEEDGALRLQPCLSPVWDTALTTIALADAGIDGQTAPVRKAVAWLLAKEVRRPGDWCDAVAGVPPAGWFFEYRNGFYPDTDDTAMVLMALARGRGGNPAQPRPHPLLAADTGDPGDDAAARAVRWLLALQNSDGGWAAFDRDINREILTKVPFADHNAMLDPSCPDITARVLEALGHHGYGVGHPAVDRGIAFIRRTQEPDCGWPGRWGVNYLYGTWQVLQGLRAVGFDMDDPMPRRAAEWLRRVQQPSGAWGESCASYDDPSLAGVGPATASQTAWGLLALTAAGQAGSDAARAAARWLVETQNADGTWSEVPFTGTGFPKVFYLKYHYYALYFPLMALCRWRRERGQADMD
jgi:squalene-hopene/tetraprenyl-beta-curcumene cyclase